MRAGKLDKKITVERSAEVLDEYGVPQTVWVTVYELRAQVVQASSEEFLKTAGVGSEAAIVFRTRFAEVTPADRILYADRIFDVKEAKEIGRRRGLEIRAVGGQMP